MIQSSRLSILGVLLNIQVALAFPGPQCALGFRFESFAYGQASGLYEVSIWPDWPGTHSRIDETCFQQGWFSGTRLRQNHAHHLRFCDQAFQDGSEQGFAGEILLLGNPSDCSQAGYIWGQANLSTGARDGLIQKVGFACILAYEKGVSDSKTQVSFPPSTNHQDAFCYQAGYFDGDQNSHL